MPIVFSLSADMSNSDSCILDVVPNTRRFKTPEDVSKLREDLVEATEDHLDTYDHARRRSVEAASLIRLD